jgi:OmpA-OmpF porin, OOP family
MNARRLVALASLAWFFQSNTAGAQSTGLAVDRFEPAPRGSAWFVLDSLDFRGSVRPAFGVVGDYAYKPLVVFNPNGSERTPVVEDQLFLHIGTSIVLFDRLRFAANLPVALFEHGDSAMLTSMGKAIALPAPGSAALGDLRLDADVRLFGKNGEYITMAAGAQVWLPTGNQTLYAGDGGVRVGPHVLAAGEAGPFAYAASAAFVYHAQDQAYAGAAIGGEVVLGGAVGLLALQKHLLIGPEIYGRTDVTNSGTFFAQAQSPVEGLLGVHLAAGLFRFGLGGGTGFTEGLGSPQARVVGSIDIIAPASAPPPPSDRDHDGILDKDDACPDEPGIKTDDPATNGCPPPLPDRDKDGVPDPDDACPDTPGVKTNDPKTNGCPPDSDHDGIIDAEDACPDVPGVRTDDPKTNGCPPPDPDRDKDGIPNDVDACPDTPGDPDPDPKKNGCPKAIVVQGQIKITEQVKFKTGSAEILAESDSILNAVKRVLEGHPEIKKISIEGHTDNVGSAAYNKNLSTKRAASVLKWLTDHGVDSGRLSSVGYGMTRPMDTNATEAGRKNNRRVEFHIVEGNAESPPASSGPSPGAPKPTPPPATPPTTPPANNLEF